MTDRSALLRARFEAVYHERYGAVWAYVRRRVGSAADTDDVTAQTWLAVWRRVEDLPDDNELAWCYGTARRCLANHRRGDGRRLRLARLIASERQIDAIRDPDPRADRLYQALDLLREDDRELLRLVAWESLSHAEIAVVLGITTANVSVRLHRAKQRLTKALKDLDQSGHTAGTAPKGTHEPPKGTHERGA